MKAVCVSSALARLTGRTVPSVKVTLVRAADLNKSAVQQIANVAAHEKVFAECRFDIAHACLEPQGFLVVMYNDIMSLALKICNLRDWMRVLLPFIVTV